MATITGPRFTPKRLFARGEQGVWYDPSDSTTLFSDAAGATPVAQPGTGNEVLVGSILDKFSTNYSVYFDGTGDYISAPDSTAFTLGSGDFTVECWIHNTTTGVRRFLFGQSNSTGSDSSCSVSLQKTVGNKLSALVVQATTFTVYTATSTADLPLSAWTHVAFVRNGNTGTLYINGTADGTVNLTGVTVNDSPNLMGVGSLGEFVSSSTWLGYISNFRFVKGTAVYTSNFTVPTSALSAISGTSLLTCGTSWSGNPVFTVSGQTRISGFNPFTSIWGNHAIYNYTSTGRPGLSARVNLLTYSEQLDNVAWGKTNITVTQNAEVAPDGTLTADALLATAVNATHQVWQTYTPFNSGTSYVFSFYVKSNGITSVFTTSDNTGALPLNCTFDLSQVTATSGGTITSVGSGWYRCSITAACTSTIGSNVYVRLTTGAFLGNDTSGIYIWGVDLRPTNIGTSIPAYQRIADQYTYDSNGFPRYLQFDGVDDVLFTPALFDMSSTDKLTMVAGVRKLSTTTDQVVFELSSNWNNNNGTFVFAAPSSSSRTYGVGARGTAAANANQIAITTTSFAEPITNVITMTSDISGDLNTIRVNGSLIASATGDQGAGNFGSYTLYIGSRNNNTLLFNGQLYGLIIRGATTDATTISTTEQWVAGKTGITI